MIYKYLVLFLFLVCQISTAQNVSIQIKGEISEAVLFKLEGEKRTEIRKIIPEKNIFHFSLNNGTEGFYSIHFDNSHSINFINDGEDVEITSESENLNNSLEIIKSESNKLYHNFLKLNQSYKTKSELLNLILLRFPKDDEFYAVTEDRLLNLQNEYLDFVKNISQKNSKSYIARYIHSSQLTVIPKEIEFEEHLNYLKSNALNHVDFNDTELIFSDAFTNKSIEYLTYYRNPKLPKELLEKEFIKAVDTLLNKAKVNQIVYQHITDYLIEGFKQYGFDKIIDYIVEKYVIEEDLCLDEETENSIQKRIDQSKLLKIGAAVPDVIMPDIDGEVVNINAIQSDRILLVFYTSQCPHCQKLLPELNEIKKRYNDIKIIAISLDKKRDEWINFVEENRLELININDPNGWDGHLASDFYIYATPTMFLLDAKKTIIAKPITYIELTKLL